MTIRDFQFRKIKDRVLATEKDTSSLEKCIMSKSKQFQSIAITLGRIKENNCRIGKEKRQINNTAP